MLFADSKRGRAQLLDPAERGSLKRASRWSAPGFEDT
jgi:hypothetical protein